MKERLKNFHHSAVFICLVLAIVLDVVLEALGRHSLFKAISYVWNQPLIFLYNCSIIFFTLTLSLLMRKRIFGYCVISFAWLILGITNCIVLGFRITPFSAIDMLMARNTITIIDKYFNVWQIVLIAALLFVALAAIIVLFIKSPTVTGNIYRTRTTVFIVATFFCVMLFTKIALNAQTISDNFANLATAYNNYGFVYCFSNSVVDVGIGQPSDYSEDKMLEIKDDLDSVGTTDSKHGKDKPNVIFVQLESFMDPSYVKCLTFNENPIPNFTKLKEECTSGFLTMPAIGAGTANSEFEVLTGFNVAYFGAGEYPYKTILGKQTIESMATQLKLDGYSTHAMHNHDGTFYDRYKVYKNMGFDTFTSKELMNITEYNEIASWPTDNILIDETTKTLDSTPDQSDFLYTITVQSHGSYPDYKVFDNPEIQVTGGDTEAEHYQWEYYINELHEVDKFIGNLIDTLSKRNEKTIVVMYGDHLPTLGLEESDMNTGNLYDTTYVTWNNFGLEKQDKDVAAYQLMSYITDQLGIHEGTMFRYHQSEMDAGVSVNDASYITNWELLQYDLLYGNRYSYHGIDKYPASNLVMGVQDVVIDHTSMSADKTKLTIFGENFTPWSKVYVDGEKVSTEYISGNCLEISMANLADGSELVVNQVGSSNTIFRSSNTVTFHAPADFDEHEADNVEVPDTSGDDMGVPVVIPPEEQTTNDAAATNTAQ